MPESVLADLHNGVLSITFDHPKANALTIDMVTAAQRAFRDAARDAQVRCVLLSGAGGIFSAGQDVRQILGAEGQSFRQHLQNTYNPLIVQIRRLEKPVVAAIAGTATGAALGIALACDLRIAAEDARFVVGFTGIGLAPDSAVSLFLPTLIGLGRATEFTFTNQPIPADLALAWGLVNRLAPADLLQERALSWATELAQGPIKAMSLAKREFNQAVYPHLEEVLDYEAHIQEIASQGSEHKEGVRAFVEKRKPRFIP